MLKQFLYRSSSPSLLFSRAFFSSTLFVKGISFSSTEESLTKAFSQFGQVVRVEMVMDKVRCRPKGFAYVTFSSNGEASKALLELNGKLVDGRVVILDTAKALKHKPNSAAKPKLFQKVRGEDLQHFTVSRLRQGVREPDSSTPEDYDSSTPVTKTV